MDDVGGAIASVKTRAERLFSTLANARQIEALVRDSCGKGYDRRKVQLGREYKEKLEALREARRATLRQELTRLDIKASSTQLEWSDPLLKPNTSTANGGVESSAVRIGSFAFNVAGRRVRHPLYLDLLHGECVIIDAPEFDSEVAAAFMRSLVLRYLVTVCSGYLRLRCFDCEQHGGSFSHFMQYLPREICGGEVAASAAVFNAMLGELDQRIAKVSQHVLPLATESLLQHNAAAKGGLEPYYVVVYDSFPGSLSANDTTRIVRLIKSGLRAGVLSIVVLGKKQKNVPADVDQLSKESVVVKIGGSDASILAQGLRLDGIKLDQITSAQEDIPLLQKLTENYRKADAGAIQFALPPETDWWKANARESVEVPIGQSDGGKPIVLRLDEKDSYGALIAGNPGNGKSNLIHVMLVQWMVKYPPDQLNLYVMDMKGTECNVYATGFPHVKTVLSEVSQEAGLAVLKDIQKLIAERKRIFARKAATLGPHETVRRLSEYNTTGGDRLPRIVVVIDEFHRLFGAQDGRASNDAEAIISDVIRTGRSFGVHLVMASQNLSTKTICVRCQGMPAI